MPNFLCTFPNPTRLDPHSNATAPTGLSSTTSVSCFEGLVRGPFSRLPVCNRIVSTQWNDRVDCESLFHVGNSFRAENTVTKRESPRATNLTLVVTAWDRSSPFTVLASLVGFNRSVDDDSARKSTLVMGSRDSRFQVTPRINKFCLRARTQIERY